MTRISIPANIDRPDTLVAGLTARQLLSLAAVAVPLWLIHQFTAAVVPVFVFIPIAALVAAVAFAVVTISHDGVSVDRTARAALAYSRAPKTLVPAGDFPLPEGLGSLGLPVVGISKVGLVDLGNEGTAVICSLFGTDLNLKSASEQESLTRALGRFLNSGDLVIQFLVHCEPIDLSTRANELFEQASSFPTLGLERFARDHAKFLSSVGGTTSLLRRDAFLVIRDPRGATDLIQRFGDAAGLLRSAGIIATLQDGTQAGRTILRLAGSPNQRISTTEQVTSRGMGTE